MPHVTDQCRYQECLCGIDDGGRGDGGMAALRRATVFFVN